MMLDLMRGSSKDILEKQKYIFFLSGEVKEKRSAIPLTKLAYL